MLGIKRRNSRLGFDLERRIERHCPWCCAQRHHVGDVGLAEDAVRHEIVGGLGGVVEPDDGDQRDADASAAPARRS